MAEESAANTPGPVPSKQEVLVIRYYNDAVIAVDELYEAALTSEGAREQLRAETVRLVERAAHWHDALKS